MEWYSFLFGMCFGLLVYSLVQNAFSSTLKWLFKGNESEFKDSFSQKLVDKICEDDKVKSKFMEKLNEKMKEK